MINDPLRAEENLARENESRKGKLLAVVCAVAITAILLVGYGFIRKYYAQRAIAENTPAPVADSGPKGPPVAHIVIDEPTLAPFDPPRRRVRQYLHRKDTWRSN